MTKATESHFYLFLANYGNKWREDADKPNSNGTKDGVITKYELKTFMIDNWDGFCPEGMTLGDLSNSLFDSFFEKLDTNYKGDTNFGQLKGKELEEMERKIALYRQLNDYIKDKCDNDYPSELDTKYFGHWKTSVADALAQAIDGKVDNLDEQSLQTALDAAYPGAKAYATATCYAAQYADSNEIKELLSDLTSQYGYRIDDDETLETIINNWINRNVTADMDTATIKSNIESIVKAYLSTADIGDGDKTLLKGLGYNDKNLNDLQRAQLKKMGKDVSEQIQNQKVTDNPITGRDGNDITETVNQYLPHLFDDAKNRYLAGVSDGSNVTPNEGESAFDAGKRGVNAISVEGFKGSDVYKNYENYVKIITCYACAGDYDSFKKILEQHYPDQTQLDEIIKTLKGWGYGLKELFAEIREDLLNGGKKYLNADGSIKWDDLDKKVLANIQANVKPKKTMPISEKTGTSDVWNSMTDNINNGYTCGVFKADDWKVDGNGYQYEYSKEPTNNTWSLKDLYNTGGGLDLLNGERKCWGGFADRQVNYDNFAGKAKNNCFAFIDKLKAGCVSKGKYEQSALDAATEKLKSIYGAAFDHCKDNWENNKVLEKYVTNDKGETYTYNTKKWGCAEVARPRAGDGGTLGLIMCEKSDGNQFMVIVDIKTIMDLFVKFYNEAL